MEIILCPVCREPFNEDDTIAIDKIRTFTHLKCLETKPDIEILEYGTFKDLVQKYA